MKYNSGFEKKVSSLLHQNQLAQLVARSRRLQLLNKPFKKVVDPQLARHCYIADYTDHQLYLIVDNNAWAARLRYSIPQLLKSLRGSSEFSELQKIHFRIQLKQPEKKPVNLSSKPKERKPLVLSLDNAHLMQEMAQTISDKKLKSALLRLAKNGLKNKA